jgi:hypothetical protein
MKKLLIFFLLLSCYTFAQKPAWVSDRSNYPKERYLSGFSMNTGKETPEFVKNLKASAQSELIEGIKVSITSFKQLTKSENAGIHSENYWASTSTFTDADVNGLKILYHYDVDSRTGYAFAYADKNEVRGYYKANISFIIQKIETAIGIARQFETEDGKSKAKKTLEETHSLFKELDFAQSLLIAIEGNEPEDAQIAKSLSLQSNIIQSLARLQTAVIVYLQSQETNFGQPVQLLAPKLKAELSAHGCSFSDHKKNADWLLHIQASTRKGHNVGDICFSYLGVVVSLIKGNTSKEIYSNTFNIKGGALDFEKAGRNAYEKGIIQIAGEIVKNIEK